MLEGNTNGCPLPGRMPADAREWAQRMELSNFINAYYQYRDLQAVPRCERVLMVGPGQGLGTEVLRWRRYDVTTFDIDPDRDPDEIGSVHDLSRFESGRFDAVIASHVLEHLPERYLDKALAEIARVGRYALVYLPVHGPYTQLRVTSNFRAVDWALLVGFTNWFERPDDATPRYMSGQHYWEVGLRGFRVRDLTKRVEAHFEVLSSYRNRDWLPSYNFTLKSKHGS